MIYFRELRELALQETLWVDRSSSGKAANEQFTGKKVTGQKTTPCKAYGVIPLLSQDANYINHASDLLHKYISTFKNKHLPWRLDPTLALN